MDIDAKYKHLVLSLTEATEERRVEWRVTGEPLAHEAYDDSPTVGVSLWKQTVLLDRVADETRRPAIRLKLFTDGEPHGRLLDEIVVSAGDEGGHDLAVLYARAKRQATGAEDAIDAIIRHLEPR